MGKEGIFQENAKPESRRQQFVVESISPTFLKGRCDAGSGDDKRGETDSQKTSHEGLQWQPGTCIWWFGEVGGGHGEGDLRAAPRITPGFNYSSAVRIKRSR